MLLSLLLPICFGTGIGIAQLQPIITRTPLLRILAVHEPSMNPPGRREPAIYDTMTRAHIKKRVQRLAAELIVDLMIVQSNLDDGLIDTSQHQVGDDDAVIGHARSRP